MYKGPMHRGGRSPDRYPAFVASLAMAAFAVMAAPLGATGCGKGAESGSRPLPTYAGHETELFDDAIEPRAVGLELDRGGPPRGDAMLRERTQVGDAVLRARIDTVTIHEDGVDTRFDLGLQTIESLAGSHAPSTGFSVRLGKGSPSTGIVRSMQTRLSGKTFVVFLREFIRADGDTELHFHMAPDDKEEKAAVRDSAALQSLR